MSPSSPLRKREPPLPGYYSGLAPFRTVFASGLPILTYHKLGPRPRHARLKGLYLSARLFDRQLAELKAAGFRSASLDELESVCRPNARRVAITFDDGFRNVFEHGLPVLARHGFQAIQFLVADRIGDENRWETADGEVAEPLGNEEEIRAWLKAGHQIGAHTLTHPWLTRLPRDRAREEIQVSRKRLEDRFSVPVRHFCHPYGDYDATVTELVREAGYATACTVEPGINTADTSPWELRRFTARYASRNLKQWWRRWRAAFGRRRVQLRDAPESPSHSGAQH